MFAKLKKTIIEKQDGDAAGDSNRNASSPLKGPLGQSSPWKDHRGYESDSSSSALQSPTGASREDLRDTNGTKEDVLVMLVKRTEQCKKLESKISEYAAIIKEKNKNLERFEASLQNQEEGNAQKIQELNEQYQMKRSKMAEGFTIALQKKDDEKEELQAKLTEYEKYKDKLYKREEETEELQGLATQELAKIKHLLLNTQEEMTKVKKECEEKKSRLKLTEKSLRDLENKVANLEQERNEFQTQSVKLIDENRVLSKMVSSLSEEKERLKEDNDSTHRLFNEKMAYLSTVEEQKIEIENHCQTLQHNYVTYKTKSNKLLEEKDGHIDQLKDRITVLEQRFQDQSLSGDDRVSALETERDNLEKKLEESRQQLVEIKSTWSDKISHLEEQISHLNTKIIEDSEELMKSEKNREMIRENFQEQLVQLQTKLKDAENQCEENLNLMKKKEKQLDKEKHEFETELNKVHFEKMDLETQLMAKITSLESQLMSVNETKTQEKELLEQQIERLEGREGEFIDKATRLEEQIMELEKNRNILENEKYTISNDESKLKEKVTEMENIEKELRAKILDLEEMFSQGSEEKKEMEKILKSKESELRTCNAEKDELLLRNAELSQKNQSVQSTSDAIINQLKSEVKDREDQIEAIQQSHDSLQQNIDLHEKTIQQLEEDKVESNQTTTQVTNLEKTVTDLQEQLADKNKALKKQEQRLRDLQKTLQRELKVQPLPSDEPVVIDGAVLTPPLQRKVSDSRNSPLRDHHFNSREQSPAQISHVMRPFDSNSFSENSKDLQKSRTVNSYNSPRKELENDLNFKYLKHVVLKFMLSRESEAIHLIRAVSVLLHFTQEEQRLIQETLEYRMSWFGVRPAFGSGQKSKYIPPPF